MRRKDSDRKRQAGEQAEAQGRKKRKKQWWEEEQEGQDASDDDDRAYYKEQVRASSQLARLTLASASSSMLCTQLFSLPK